MLNQNQLQSIIQTLKASGIKYHEVYEELLDHYATAIEGKIEQGQAFDEALHEVHQEFGARRGVKQIQECYYKQIWNHYRLMQWQHFKQLFRWPQMISSLIIGILVYFIANLLQDTKIIKLSVFLIALLPLFMAFTEYIRIIRNSPYSKNSAKGNLLIHISGLGLGLLNLLVFVPRVFFNDIFDGKYGIDILALYPAALAVVLAFYILYFLSFFHSLQKVRASLV